MTEENVSQDQDYQAPEISPKKHPVPHGRHRFRELLLEIPAVRRQQHQDADRQRNGSHNSTGLRLNGPLAEGVTGPASRHLPVADRSQEEINEPLINVNSPHAAASTFKNKSFSIAENTLRAKH